MRWPFDNGLLLLSALLFAIGLVALFSATGGGNYFYQQLMWGGIGFLAMAALAWMPLPAIEWVSPAAFAAGVLALVAVFFSASKSTTRAAGSTLACACSRRRR